MASRSPEGTIARSRSSKGSRSLDRKRNGIVAIIRRVQTSHPHSPSARDFVGMMADPREFGPASSSAIFCAHRVCGGVLGAHIGMHPWSDWFRGRGALSYRHYARASRIACQTRALVAGILRLLIPSGL